MMMIIIIVVGDIFILKYLSMTSLKCQTDLNVSILYID